MRKLPLLLAFLLLLSSSAAPAAAETTDSPAWANALGDADETVVRSMVERIGHDLSEDEKRLLFQAFTGEGVASGGTVTQDIYSSPLGFSFQIPTDYLCEENGIGATVLLTGPADDEGFSTTISVQIFLAEQPLFATLTPEEIEPLFGQTLPNYHFVSMDDFEYRGVKAREFVFVHGASADSILMQYQLFFNREGKSYILTMTTLAEEAAHESALGIYDAFVTNFSFDAARVEPVQTPGPTAEPAKPTDAPQGGAQGNG